MNKTNILVTGGGALLGQGILRCLNERKNEYYTISADPSHLSTGHFISNESILIPFANSPEYLTSLINIIKDKNVDYLFVGTDIELPIISEHREEIERFNCKVIVSSPEVISISNDKYKTAKFLEEHNFPFPISARTSCVEEINTLKELGEYPYIAKPADGARSKGIVMVNSSEDLDEICKTKNNLVVQEYLSEDFGEFTTGCLVINGKCKSIVSLKRDLRDGNTWRAYRDEKTSIYDDVIKSIAEKLDIDGPVNFQYRIKKGQPVIFEINGRFSGTTPIRSFFGHNEVTSILDYYIHNKEILQPSLRNGIALRTFSDLFIEPSTMNDFEKEKHSKELKSTYYPFKKSL